MARKPIEPRARGLARAAGAVVSGEAKPRLVLAGAVLGSSLAFIDSSAVSLTLPVMQKQLGGGVAAAQWIMNFIVTLTFPMMDGSSFLNARFNHGFAYWVYGVCALLAGLFVIRFMPETKGRTLESIQELWHRRRGDASLVSSRAAD